MTEPDSSPATEREDLPGLYWAIKRSFVAYIARTRDGAGSVSRGAVPLDSDIVVFEPDGGEPASADGAERTLRFRGDVRFKAHAGMLWVRVADPWITLTGTTGQMSVRDPWSFTEPPEPDDKPRIPLVTFEVQSQPTENQVEVFYARDVLLTQEGVELFNDQYAVGEPFEPLMIRIPPS